MGNRTTRSILCGCLKRKQPSDSHKLTKAVGPADRAATWPVFPSRTEGACADLGLVPGRESRSPRRHRGAHSDGSPFLREPLPRHLPGEHLERETKSLMFH